MLDHPFYWYRCLAEGGGGDGVLFLCNQVAQVVQPHQRPEAKEQWHSDMDPLDARSKLIHLKMDVYF